jgi:hypothetical protein
MTRLDANHPPPVLSFTAEGMTHLQPPATGGSVTVEGPAIESGGCPADEPGESRPVPSGLAAVFKLEGGSAARGEPVRVPFIINAGGEVIGFSLSADFDEEALEATSVEKVFRKPDGSAWSYERFRFDNSNRVPGNAGIDEGFIAGAGVFSFNEKVALPAETENEVLAFHFLVRPEAPLGTTELRFLDGAMPPQSVPVHNVVTLAGIFESNCPDSEVAPLLIFGRLQIVPDISIFIRGDSNGDRTIDISDAQATLGFLFLGSPRPRCLDAADANDDGALDISDPIATLIFLFLVGRPLPPPGGAPAEDPTPDGLSCTSRTR